MFTGIIQKKGKVIDFSRGILEISTNLDLSDCKLGSSICCNGVCLTATEINFINNLYKFKTNVGEETMLRTTLIYDFFKKRGKMIINIISYVIGIMLFVGIAVGGWTDMIKGWEIGEYQGIGAIEFPVYPIRTVIIFSSIIVVFIYLSLIIKSFMSDK